MQSVFETAPAAPAIPIIFATKASWDAIRDGLGAPARQFALANDFAAKPGKCLILPSADGQIAQVIFGLEDEAAKSADPFRPGALPGLLPPGTYRFANAPHDTRLATLAFALGSYRFSRYRKAEAPNVRLVPSDGIDGDELPRQNFPLIHAVGMASPRAPRLIDIGWGDPSHPKVTLVGKGVCFDTGGLDLKPSSGMLIMKKDMGGAASVLALALMVMDARLKVRLRVLIPAVENAVAGNAFRALGIF